MSQGLERLGFHIETNWPVVRMAVHSNRNLIPASSAEIFVGNSGTTMRFLTALCSIGVGKFRLDGTPRMRERPIQDLLDALQSSGVKAYSEFANGCPPVIVEANGLLEGLGPAIKGDVSSQFISALLLIAPFNQSGLFRVRLDGRLVSEPYIRMTETMMRQWGATWWTEDDGRSFIFDYTSRSHYPQSSTYEIEPDASAASYFFAAAAITGGTITVSGLSRQSIQGDIRFVDLLEQMGCRVEACSSGITVHGRPLRGINVDMNDISDTVMTLGAVACFADGSTTIRNVAHIRHKETDRITALATELRRVGAEIEEFTDGLRIMPKPLHGAEIDTYDDHRIAMSMALIGLTVPGIAIRNPGCVAKTYPGFWEDLDRLR